MPVFGEYETNDEPLAVTPARNQTTTVWLARKSGTPDGRQFAIKCLAVHRDERSHASDETLGADPGLEFIETVKQLKKAQADGSRDFAPLHAFGTSDFGCWYATDYCARGSLKTWINLRGGVDSAAVQHVVSSLAEGCKSLKKICGRSHGNLKPSNVLLQGKARPLKSTPLLMVDAMPVSTSRVSGMDADNRTMVENIFEAQDLRAIGEIIVQLVERRLIESESDYAYPIESSPDWQKLGKDERRWRELCNRLLDPQLELDKTNLDWLARAFPAGRGVQKILVPVAAALVLAAAGVVLFHVLDAARFRNHVTAADTDQNDDDFIRAAQEIREALNMRPTDPGAIKLSAKIFSGLVQSAQNEVNDGNWKTAQEQTDLAGTLKSGDPAVTRLNEEIQRGTGYQQAIDAVQEDFDRTNYDEAIRQAKIALEDSPKDNRAEQLLAEAETARHAIEIQNEAQEAGAREQGYQTAMNAVRDALRARNYDEAIRQADTALVYKPGDPEAGRLKTEAQNDSAAATARAAEANVAYDTAMQAGREALEKKDYDEAIRQANLALANKTGDTDAGNLLSKATSQKTIAHQAQVLQDQYKAAMAAGQNALSEGNYPEAINQAKAALGIVPGDSEALKLQSEAQAAIEAQARRQRRDAAMTAGNAALSDKQYDKAIWEADVALTNSPGDSEATRLKTEAVDAQLRLRNYQSAMAAARDALQNGDYGKAIAQANVALENERGDPDATALVNDATQRQNYKRAMAAGNAAYGKAQTATGRAEYARAQYEEAIGDADTALANEPDDSQAQQLKNAAQTKVDAIDAALARQRKYDNAMKLGNAALAAGNDAIAAGNAAAAARDYQQASQDARNALDIQSSDAPAKQLQTDSAEGLFNTYIALGRAALSHGDYKGAIQYAKAATTIKDGPEAQDLETRAQTAKNTLDRLDGNLSQFLKCFGMSQERGSSIAPDPDPKVTKFPPIDDPTQITYYLTLTTNLEQGYIQGGWLDQERRRDIIQHLRNTIKNYGE
ncbi:MAG TPA: hypothetical protein VME24_02125 [Alphaproteobacteria bacterium]|nr:hypothetical protein [Alphaproteobacteria bacterium]